MALLFFTPFEVLSLLTFAYVKRQQMAKQIEFCVTTRMLITLFLKFEEIPEKINKQRHASGDDVFTKLDILCVLILWPQHQSNQWFLIEKFHSSKITTNNSQIVDYKIAVCVFIFFFSWFGNEKHQVVSNKLLAGNKICQVLHVSKHISSASASFTTSPR